MFKQRVNIVDSVMPDASKGPFSMQPKGFFTELQSLDYFEGFPEEAKSD